MHRFAFAAAITFGAVALALPGTAMAGGYYKDACKVVDKYFIDDWDTTRGDVNENIRDSNAPFNNLKGLLKAYDFHKNDTPRELRECVREIVRDNRNNGAVP